MHNKTKQELEAAEYFDKWFLNHDITKHNFWARNPAAKIIKKHLESAGKWRNRARGNPKLGRAKMLENKTKTLQITDKNLDW